MGGQRKPGSPSVRHTAGSEDTEDATAFSSVWDGDDMTLDMVTDVNESQVDEDVSPFRLSFFDFTDSSTDESCP